MDPISAFTEHLMNMPLPFWQGIFTAFSMFFVWRKFANYGWLIAIGLFVLLILMFGIYG